MSRVKQQCPRKNEEKKNRRTENGARRARVGGEEALSGRESTDAIHTRVCLSISNRRLDYFAGDAVLVHDNRYNACNGYSCSSLTYSVQGGK